ncbi:MAG: hypothetical protein JWN37_785 [Candidatus Nomurabacteria bacterium]|nr:hypothetical protein [Candidatus Nomurabacteria bacterium]
MKKYFPHLLLLIYAVEFVALGIHPIDRHTWWVENLTVLLIVAVIIGLYIAKIRFSNIAYLLMSILIFMHTIGGHYTFAAVPFDWFDNFFGFERNMYDRVAHATVGFYAYPIIESAIKYRWVNKKWFAYLAGFMIIPAVAAFYEIFEWQYAVSSDPGAGIAVLGSQGDIWDAQKDMLMDTIGALIGTVFYFLIGRRKEK